MANLAHSLVVDIAFRRRDFKLQASLAISSGITLISGNSGSGKTTLLDLIAGYLNPSLGQIELDQQFIWSQTRNLPINRRNIGYAHQESRLFPHWRVNRNLLPHTKWWRQPRFSSADADLLRRLGIYTLISRPAKALSGGQARRIAIARAILQKPRLLLLDEPFADLDTDNRHVVAQILTDFASDANIPVIVATHISADLFPAAHQFEMIDGQLQQPL